MRIECNWPDRELHPNARVYRLLKAKYARMARRKAAYAAQGTPRTEREGEWLASDDIIPYGLVIQPADKRRRDEDNIIASLKSTLDGIADGLGVNDQRLRLMWVQWLPPAKPPRIIVALLERPPAQLMEVFDDKGT